jgi:hypothetical protein
LVKKARDSIKKSTYQTGVYSNSSQICCNSRPISSSKA